MPSGTDCRLRERLKIEIEPPRKYDAKATMTIKAMLLKESPRVLGSEISAACLMSEKLIDRENRGKKPEEAEARA